MDGTIDSRNRGGVNTRRGAATRRGVATRRGAIALGCLAQRRWRRGFSLFGVLLGLTLAAVAIVGAVGLYNAARQSANRSEALSLLNQLRANVESIYAGAPSYGNDTDLIATVDRRGGIPDTARMVSGTAVQIRHPFGGLMMTGGPGGNTNQFRIVFNDVDDEVCAGWATRCGGTIAVRAGTSRSRPPVRLARRHAGWRCGRHRRP